MQISIPIIGLIGAIIGGVLTVFGNLFIQWFKERKHRKLDRKRKKVLCKMLNDDRFSEKWRRLSTLARVIGASKETTKRLLIEIDARGSEKDDGLWGLISNHPFEEI